MKRFIVVRDKAPRSGKVTIYLAKLVEYDDHMAVYDTWAKTEYMQEALKRCKDLNETAQRFPGAL